MHDVCMHAPFRTCHPLQPAAVIMIDWCMCRAERGTMPGGWHVVGTARDVAGTKCGHLCVELAGTRRGTPLTVRSRSPVDHRAPRAQYQTPDVATATERGRSRRRR